MATLEERVSYLEGKVEEHSRGFGELRQLIGRLDEKVDRLDDKVDRRIDALDQKVDRFRQELAGRIDGLDQKFAWVLGIQVTTLVAIVAALLAR